MDQNLNPPVSSKKKSLIKYILFVLVCEKIIQHIVVTLAFYFNWKDIRSSVAVSPDVLLASGGIIAFLFIVSLWGILRQHNWVTSLLIFLALFDMIGEFVAQGTIGIVITVSFLVATLLLILTIIYRRQRARSDQELRAKV